MEYKSIKNGIFYNGDCLEVMKSLRKGSIDMVLCDLPYGTTSCSWDTIIPFNLLWEQYWRICKSNAVIALFGTEPFSSSLRLGALDYFKYDWIWNKSNPSGFAQAKNMPLKCHEIISVFSKGSISHENKFNNRMPYNPQNIKYKPRVCMNSKRSKEEVSFGNRPSHKKGYKQEFTNYPKSILDFKVERGIHPTQKPVSLLEFFIKTYSNEGNTILDNTAGSGSLAIACENTRRKWICIEKEELFYKKAIKRIERARNKNKLGIVI